ncbi:MAG: recombinase family protein [Erysipelotrichaceae bacterium]
MRKIYGYVRVSSRDQNEARQYIELLDYGIDKKMIYMDKLSGKDFNRPSYHKLVYKKIKKGDLIIIKSIDRLGRNYNEILAEWKYITKDKNVDIKILDMPLLDTDQNKDLLGTLIGDIVLQLLSFVAENERINIRQRQAEGIKAAQQRGVRFGRPKVVLPHNFPIIYKQWLNNELTSSQAINQSGLKYSTFYKKVKEYKKNTEVF